MLSDQAMPFTSSTNLSTPCACRGTIFSFRNDAASLGFGSNSPIIMRSIGPIGGIWKRWKELSMVIFRNSSANMVKVEVCDDHIGYISAMPRPKAPKGSLKTDFIMRKKMGSEIFHLVLSQFPINDFLFPSSISKHRICQVHILSASAGCHLFQHSFRNYTKHGTSIQFKLPSRNG